VLATCSDSRFEYASSEEVRDELRHELDACEAGCRCAAFAQAAGAMDVTREVAIYGVDAIVRRSARCRPRWMASTRGRSAA